MKANKKFDFENGEEWQWNEDFYNGERWCNQLM